MQASNKQLEFWGMLIFICTMTAIFVLVIDMTIKGAILEESNALRRVIEEDYRGQGRAKATDGGNSNDSHINPSLPSDLVDRRTARMEKTGDNKSGTRPADSGPIPPGNE